MFYLSSSFRIIFFILLIR